jgi:PAS domain S-box-containing protein
MNDRLLSLCTPCPDGFTFCREFRVRDFRRSTFALYAPSTEVALEFFGQDFQRLAGLILIPGDHLSSEEMAPLLSKIIISSAMLPYLADFAAHQLLQLDQRINSEERRSFLTLENERLELNNQRASEEFTRFRDSLLHEIEERRSAERQLAENEELLRLIMSSTVEAIYGIDTEGICTFANESCLKLLGYEHIGEVLGRNMHDLIHYRTADGLPMPVEECLIFKAFREGNGVTVTDEFFWRRDGSSLPVEYSSYPIRKNNVIVGAVVTWRDISERRQRESALRETQELFALFMNYSPIYTFIKEVTSTESRVLQASENFAQMIGIPGSKMIGKNMFELFPAELAAKITDDDWKVVSNAEMLELEEELNGRSYTTIKFPIVQGSRTLLAGYTIDITDRKRAEEERERIEKQLLHSQKLESLGVLASGLAHDFNNILTAIIGNADLALMRINKESPAVDNLHRIEQSALRAADLAKQMLAYSGKGKFMVSNIDLNLLLEEMLHMLEVSISKNALLRLNLHRPLPTVEADATQMRQILMNLVINASEAIGERSGVIAITTGCMDCDRSYLKDVWLDENLTDGFYVYLEIADSGCGMDQETLAKLFDPFFTTKFTGRGLGMAAVLGIVRGHKGAIKVYSEPDRGTSFKILLPASGKPVEIFNGESDRDDWQGSGTVLLVDDEETVRGIGAEMLKELGFTVITANDGKEAVDIFKVVDDIVFVILDLTMPHMDGEQCFRELRHLKPDVKIIMSSGFNEHEVTQKFVGRGLSGFIQKPYKLSVLKETIRVIA